MFRRRGTSKRIRHFDKMLFRDEVLNASADLYETFTFDFFDTLVFRKSSTHVSGWKKLSLGFCLNRIIAEVVARVIARIYGRPEVKMKEIYRYMIPIWRPEIEIEWETQNLLPNSFMRDIFNQLADQGKRILVISDTHFDSVTLSSWLDDLGFRSCSVITSQEFIKTKSTGLYELLHAKFDIPYDSWIHIGDNTQSDIQAASRLGIRAEYWPKLSDQLRDLDILSRPGIRNLYKSGNDQFAISTYLRQSFCEVTSFVPDSDEQILWHLGLFVGASVSRAISNEIHAEQLEKEFDSILFSSRDGWLPYKWHKIQFPEDPIFYFKTSRSMISNTNYVEYVKSITGDSEKVAIFDFGWRGSTLKFLRNHLPEITWKGYFWQIRNRGLSNASAFQPTTTNSLHIWRARDFIELVFTDPSNGYSSIDKELTPIERMKRSGDSKRLAILRGSLDGIRLDLPALTLRQSALLLELFSQFPSKRLSDSLANETHEIGEGLDHFLVTNSWARLFSKNRIMWPRSAHLTNSFFFLDKLGFRFLVLCKEFMQRFANLINLFLS